MIEDSAAEQLTESGFLIIRNFFNLEEILELESNFLEFYILQASKIQQYRDRALNIQKSNKSNAEKIDYILEMMEENDKEALYQVQKFFSSSPLIMNLFNGKLLNLCASILVSNNKRLLVEGPGLFINRPNTERLLYKWHSEVDYYPKRRRFLNIWFPIFRNKSKSNGTISFKEKTHKFSYPHSHYSCGDSAFGQLEIPEFFLEGHSEIFIDAAPTDLVIFDRNLVHRSNANISKEYTYAVVSRIWDPSDDLTLSGDISAAYLGKEDAGRQDLVVDTLR
jgi:hypothetical protein